MRNFLVAGLLAVGAVASPLVERAQTCMTTKDSVKVAQNFRALIHETFNTTLAKTAMTKQFHDYSDSVIELINSGCTTPVALGSATFSTRKEFITGQSGQPPIPFKILNLWHTCTTVVIRWRATAPGNTTLVPDQEPVTGIIVIETLKNHKKNSDQPFLIDTVFSEFNSGAWLYDLGVFVPTCTTSSATPSSSASSSTAAPSATGSAAPAPALRSKRAPGAVPFIGML